MSVAALEGADGGVLTTAVTINGSFPTVDVSPVETSGTDPEQQGTANYETNPLANRGDESSTETVD